jgi:hypothetical protein
MILNKEDMKKIIILLSFVAFISCEQEPICKKCQTIYNPMIHPPETFSVCNNEDYEYWNGRQSTCTDSLGNVFQLKTTCK